MSCCLQVRVAAQKSFEVMRVKGPWQIIFLINGPICLCADGAEINQNNRLFLVSSVVECEIGVSYICSSLHLRICLPPTTPNYCLEAHGSLCLAFHASPSEAVHLFKNWHKCGTAQSYLFIIDLCALVFIVLILTCVPKFYQLNMPVIM
jgi:hypothetical protein